MIVFEKKIHNVTEIIEIMFKLFKESGDKERIWDLYIDFKNVEEYYEYCHNSIFYWAISGDFTYLNNDLDLIPFCMDHLYKFELDNRILTITEIKR